jgi:hypothetical protein
MLGKKPYHVMFVTDPKISREKMQMAIRGINALGQISSIQYVPGLIPIEDLAKRLESEKFDVILMPWHLYFKASKIESILGSNRTSGTTFAGYFADPISASEIKNFETKTRAILLDLYNLQPAEVSVIVRSMLDDRFKWGLKSFIKKETPIYFKSWSASRGLGATLDGLFHQADFVNSPVLKHRKNTVRTLVNSLWSLVFDEGPGRNDTLQTQTERAYFECAFDAVSTVVRICYRHDGFKPMDAVNQFWIQSKSPCSPSQTLLNTSDFIKIFCDVDTGSIEICCLLLKSELSEKHSFTPRSFWIEPAQRTQLQERFTENDFDSEQRHHELQSPFEGREASVSTTPLKTSTPQSKEDKSSSKPSSSVFVYPSHFDGESVVELFKQKLSLSRTKIKNLQKEILTIKSELRPVEDERDEDRALKKKMGELFQEIRDEQFKQKAWVQKANETVNEHLELSAPKGSEKHVKAKKEELQFQAEKEFAESLASFNDEKDSKKAG